MIFDEEMFSIALDISVAYTAGFLQRRRILQRHAKN